MTKRLGPETIARDGLDEEIVALSGGTREQIAILTRLAFPRLLVRAGRATPVILDDAIVYADDARFARMLDAIGLVSADVQVIVLTCRERALSVLPALASHHDGAKQEELLVGRQVPVEHCAPRFARHRFTSASAWPSANRA